jgi:SAM-dependent methyltransferase
MTNLAGVFGHPGVAASYRHRPPYPAEVFDQLERLIVDKPRTVLDLGAGEGALARRLAPRVDRVDAVDISEAMIAAGKERPGGRHENLRWILGAAESADLDGPYALVTAGASLHWMDLDVTLGRTAEVMTPDAQFAVVEHGPRDQPWEDELISSVIRPHSRNPDFDTKFSIIDALTESGLYAITGRAEIGPMPFEQSADDYIEHLHSTSSLAREHMSDAEIEEFGNAIRRVVAPYENDGMLELAVVAELTWGRPVRTAAV